MMSSEAPEEIKKALIALALLCAKHRYQLDVVPGGQLRDVQTTLASVLRARDIQLDLIEGQRGLISKQHYELAELRRKLTEYERAIHGYGDKVRALIWHPESEALFESTDQVEVWRALDQGCEDVSDRPEFEERYAMQQDDDM